MKPSNDTPKIELEDLIMPGFPCGETECPNLGAYTLALRFDNMEFLQAICEYHSMRVSAYFQRKED